MKSHHEQSSQSFFSCWFPSPFSVLTSFLSSSAWFFFKARSVCPRSRLGAITLRTRDLRALTSAKTCLVSLLNSIKICQNKRVPSEICACSNPILNTQNTKITYTIRELERTHRIADQKKDNLLKRFAKLTRESTIPLPIPEDIPILRSSGMKDRHGKDSARHWDEGNFA